MLSSLYISKKDSPVGAAQSTVAAEEVDPGTELDPSCRSVLSGRLVSSETIGRRQRICYELVARFPGAIEVTIEAARQGERPLLVVYRINDAAAVGGFGDGGDLTGVGLAVAAIAKRRHVAEQPPPPSSLNVAISMLGRDAHPSTFPLYVHVCEPRDVIAMPRRIVDTSPMSRSGSGNALQSATSTTSTPPGSPRPLPSFASHLWLQQVIVATTRRPVLDKTGGSCAAKFATTLDVDDQEAKNQPMPIEADEGGVYWGIATIGYSEPFEVIEEEEPVGDVSKFHYLGFESMSRADALARLGVAAGQQNCNRGCLVYVHGFNTGLVFAARSAALYGRAFRRTLVVCFAWPSNPPLPKTWAISAVLSVAERNYTAAEQMLHRSVPALAAVAKHLRSSLPEECPIHWKAHSMGCYLSLSVLERILLPTHDDQAAKRAAEAHPFARVVLDAPDCPTWFFVDVLKRAGSKTDVRFLHYYNPNDEAVELARQRRGLEFPAPGNGRVTTIDLLSLQVVNCANTKASMGKHDYGRIDPAVLRDQRSFLDAIPPEDRNLVHQHDRISSTSVWAFHSK